MKSIAMLLFVISSFANAQGWGHHEAMDPWLRGRFAEAEQRFHEMQRLNLPGFVMPLVWGAEFEMERGRFATAGTLLREAARQGTSDSLEPINRRRARLLIMTGQFSEAEKAALAGAKWDGTRIDKLKLSSPIALNTIGEVYLSRARYTESSAVFEKAAVLAKKSWQSDSPEWIRAQDGIALSALGSGDLVAAADRAQQALATAEREWGRASIPALDSLDVLGLVRLSQARLDDATSAIEQVLQTREAFYGPEHLKVAESYMHAALLHAAEHDYGAALRLGNHGLDLQQRILGGPNGKSALALAAVAALYVLAGSTGEAMECYKNAIPVLQQSLGDEAPVVAQTRQRYLNLLSPLPNSKSKN